MMDRFFEDPEAAVRLRVGPLASQVDSFAEVLAEQGYSRTSARQKLNLVAKLSLWLKKRQLNLDNLDEEKLKEFLAYRRRCGDRSWRARAVTLEQLLAHLRAKKRIPAPAPKIDDRAIGHIERRFVEFLFQERALAEATVVGYLSEVQQFLTWYSRREGDDFSKLSPKHIHRFIVHYARTASRKRAKLMTTVLHSFLRFLHVRGEVDNDLAVTVPTVAEWRLSTVPKFLQPEEVERLVQNCDQETPNGQRDHAVLLLLARLGLRAGEVAKMTLEDIDWEAGEITLRGSKRSGYERLPIPRDVGEALVAYLRHGRPRCKSRRVFVRTKAPRRGFSSSVAVCNIVERGLQRAGLTPTHKGAHLLRHSLATHMLRQGASLAEIGDVLGHRGPNTTQIYAKCDVEALRELARPWPGVAP